MRQRRVLLFGVILATGIAAFCVGRTAAVMRQNRTTGGQPEWLDQADPETVRSELDFQEQTRQLADALRAEQSVLASMLPDMSFTREQILTQVGSVNESYATLARSVGVHLARLRNTLPEDQKLSLLRSCGNSLRGSMQRRYRWRGGAQDQGDAFRGGRRGGPGQGEGGRGVGYGRQYRGGRNESTSGLDRRLQLTQEQSAWIHQQDPNFEEQCVVLRDRLYEVHAGLVASFESAQLTKQELATKIDDLLAAHDALEKRVAQHIVLLRPRLSQEQRDLLSSLCRGGSRTDGSPVSGGHKTIRDVMAGLLGEQSMAGLP